MENSVEIPTLVRDGRLCVRPRDLHARRVAHCFRYRIHANQSGWVPDWKHRTFGASIESIDHKFVYGPRIPFTKTKLFEWRKPQRGEVVVFMYPRDPDTDFIKRVVAVEGDTVAVRQSVVYVNGEPVDHTVMPDLFSYWDVIDDKIGSLETRARRARRGEGKCARLLHPPHARR